ncbi:UNVERIFIED_CONTAM: hypothetical protein Cloal_0632 [Acetivibrio alkalicellulosi]
MKNDRLITCNRDWTGITVLDKKGHHVYLDYLQIEEIRFGYYTISRLFSKKATEKIEIHAKGLKSPIILTKPMDWEHFDQYKREIIKFANDNKIAILDND